MLPKKKNGERATELKDLDVDRIDIVDHPATGRAFALFKSADTFYETDAAHIAAVIRKVMPSVEQIYANLILKACDDCIVKCLDGSNKPIGFIVKGAMTNPRSLDECVKFVE